MERIERSSVAYHATALPWSYIGLEPEGVIFSGLEAQGTPHIPRPLIHQFRDAIQLSKICIETHFYCVASMRKRVRQNGSNYR